MSYLLIKHRVASFEKWKPAYDKHITMRKSAGLSDVHLLRDSADPNVVVLLFKAADPSKAKSFTQSADLKEVMQQAGVIGTPEILFLNE